MPVHQGEGFVIWIGADPPPEYGLAFGGHRYYFKENPVFANLRVEPLKRHSARQFQSAYKKYVQEINPFSNEFFETIVQARIAGATLSVAEVSGAPAAPVVVQPELASISESEQAALDALLIGAENSEAPVQENAPVMESAPVDAKPDKTVPKEGKVASGKQDNSGSKSSKSFT